MKSRRLIQSPRRRRCGATVGCLPSAGTARVLRRTSASAPPRRGLRDELAAMHAPPRGSTNQPTIAKKLPVVLKPAHARRTAQARAQFNLRLPPPDAGISAAATRSLTSCSRLRSDRHRPRKTNARGLPYRTDLLRERAQTAGTAISRHQARDNAGTPRQTPPQRARVCG
jgi:hypothetical protein